VNKQNFRCVWKENPHLFSESKEQEINGGV
jgi:hypothetical protein